MKKKLIYFKLISFVLIFIFLFSLNFLYKNYIINLNLFFQYKISALQINEYKQKQIQHLIEQIFLEEKLKYKIDKLHIEDSIRFIEGNAVTEFSAILNLSEYFDEQELEREINESFTKKIKKTNDELVKFLLEFDYNKILSEYLNSKKNLISIKYENLINSNFFKNYPPKNCIKTKEICYAELSSYYTNIYFYILKNLDNNSKNKYKIFNNKDILEIYGDFNSNKNLYLTDDIFINEKKKREFFKKKYEKIIKTDIFYKHINDMKNECLDDPEYCVKKITHYLTKLIVKNNYEIEYLFTIKKIKFEEKNFNPFIDLPIIIGLSLVLSYLVFICRNLFFKRKS